ncbi:MAG: Ser-Thr-rich GPI-anchored membrane family protein [Acidobacteriota bacterium]
MKKLIFVTLLISLAFIGYSQEISNLGISGGYYDIKSDNTGTVHIIWLDLNGWAKYGQIVNRQVVNQITIPNLARSEVNYRKFRPRIAVRPDGKEVHFSWVTPSSYPTKLMHAWKNSSGVWNRETIYTPPANNYVEYPAVTVDSAGVTHASCIQWKNNDSTHPVLYFRKPAGGSWAQQANIAPDTSKQLWITLFTDSSGNVHVTWDSNDKKFINYRSAPSGGNLGSSTTTTLGSNWDHNKQSDVFVDTSGNVHVAALSYDDPGTHVGFDYWSKPVGSGFTAPKKILADPFYVSRYFPHPVVIGHSQDMVAVSWAEGVLGTPMDIRVATYNGSDWILYTLDTTANFNEWTKTALALNSTTAFLVWRSSDKTFNLATFDFNMTGVISPNGGESWEMGSTHEIKWNLENATGNVDINLYKNNVNLGPIVSGIADSGSFNWTINTLESGAAIQTGSDYQIEVKAIDNSDSDMSNAFFAVDYAFEVTSPVSTDVWSIGQNYNITWTTPLNASPNVKINIYKDSIDAPNFIEQLTGPNNGTYNWTIPGSYVAGNYILRLKTDDGLLVDDSDVFSISGTSTLPAITVTSPTSTDTWNTNSTYDITWDRTGTLSANIKINVFKDSIDAANFVEQLTGPNSGTYSWTIPDTYSAGNYILRVKTDDGLVSDDSDLFAITSGGSITPSITITSPTASSIWNTNSTYNITWDRTGTLSANIKINVFKDSIDTANFIEQLTGPNSGTYSWTIPGTYSAGNYILRVKTDDGLVSDDSDVFQIADGSTPPPDNITVVSPSSCSSWSINNTYTITWLKEGTMSANVKINIFKDYIDTANFVEQLTGPNTGSIDWTIPGSYSDGNYILRIKTDDGLVSDDSQTFTVNSTIVSTPSITVTSPTSCDTWTKLKTYKIAWSKAGTMSANVKINIFKDSINTANFVEQLTGPNTGSIDWTIPGTYTNGNYIIRVKTDDSAVLGDSSLFAVTN